MLEGDLVTDKLPCVFMVNIVNGWSTAVVQLGNGNSADNNIRNEREKGMMIEIIILYV